MGVQIGQPNDQELAQMVFGPEVHPDLIQYLVTKKPKFVKEQYQEETTKMMNQTFKQLGFFESPYTMQIQHLYQQLVQQPYYDPRNLFQTDDEFYSLLQKHPSYKEQNYGHLADEGEALLDRDESDDQQQDEDPLQNVKTALKDLGSQITKQFGVLGKFFQKKDKKEEEEVKVPIKFELQSGLYAHGCCFQPSFMRMNPAMRGYLLQFLAKQPIQQNCPVFQPKQQAPFRLTYVNVAHAVSPTYPCLLAVPQSVSDENVKKAMKFRSRGRIAALSWINPRTKCSITRCSQPGKGFGLSRDPGDEELLNKIAEECRGFVVVFDARPFLNAFGNRIAGKGFESTRAYPFCRTYYCGIENIHAVRDSFEAMLAVFKAVKEESQDFGSVGGDSALFSQFSQKKLDLSTKIQKTKWFAHISTILVSANMMAQTVCKQNASAMVHCSDGWDRTSQLSALAMLLADPYWRTLKGFVQLIEKEWLSFGHMFATRNRLAGASKASKRKDSEFFKLQGVGEELQSLEKSKFEDLLTNKGENLAAPPQQALKFSSSQTSPVFLQFLECVFQVINQFPEKFEFNGKFLRFLAEEIYNGGSNTFIFDCEHMRVKFLTGMLGKSSWEQLDGKFVNGSYVAKKMFDEDDLILVNATEEYFSVWEDFWM